MTEDELEFQRLYDEFRPKILRYLKRLVGEYAAEDLTQDVFIKVNKGLQSFRGESKISTWIYKIATNSALDKFRGDSSKQIVQRRAPQDLSSPVKIEIQGKGIWSGEKPSLPDDELIRREMNDCIRNFIEQLPTDYRTVLVLSELEGLKNIQIADILGTTLSIVKIRLHRARTKLKKELESHCSFYRDERNELACDLKTALQDLREE